MHVWSSRRLRTVLGALLCLALLELAPRVWLFTHHVYTVSEFRFARPAAYARSPFWSWEWVLDDSHFLQSVTLNDAGWWTSDYHSRWHNHEGLIRATVGQPAGDRPALYMLGSSTVVNYEVPDAYTIASYLQARLGQSYRVVNMGQLGSTVPQQTRLLRTLALRPGDIVVFYDGVVDSVNGSKQRAPGICDSARLSLVVMVCQIIGPQTPEQRPDYGTLRDTFTAAIREARSYTSEHGAGFWHFLEPSLWSIPPQNGYEQALLDNPNIVPPQFTAYHNLVWPMLQAATRETGGVDLTHAVDGLRTATFSPLIDYDHMSEMGNERMAQAIYDQLSIY